VTDQGAVVAAIGIGEFAVEHNGRTDIVYAIEADGIRWAFWNGRVYRQPIDATPSRSAGRRRGADASQGVAAPMPATVLKVLVAAGAEVKKGDTLVVLEAMKMELPLRAPADATVKAVHCAEGDLVQADAVLVDL
jgi:biotin carboxyl carrier protein